MSYDDDDDDDGPGFFSTFLKLGLLAGGGYFLWRSLSGQALAADVGIPITDPVTGALIGVSPPAAAATSTGAPGADPNAPRGIRNNNPGNIAYSPANNWDGQIGQDDGGFVIFSDPVYGLRAMYKLLRTYQPQILAQGPPAVFDIISISTKWTTTDRQAWVNAVEAVSGIKSTQSLNPNDEGQMNAIVNGIVAAENGHDYIGTYAGLYDQAWAMAA